MPAMISNQLQVHGLQANKDDMNFLKEHSGGI